jgi:5'-nucleotidase
MFDLPLDLSRTRILVTNDDGIHAQGLKVLEAIARELSDDVWVVAPEMEQSAASHSLTINRPLRLRKLDERRFTVDGTPTDCVLLAVNHVMKDARPTLVLSGVNQGSNIGEDVTYSGTIAAAMEATLLNVDFPARPAAEVTGIQVVRHGKRKIGDELLERVDPRGKPYIWIGTLRGEADVSDDTDIHVVFNGGISVTPVYLDLTHTPTLQTLRQAFV